MPEVPRQGSEGSRTRGRRAAKLSTVCAGHARAAWRPPPRRPAQSHDQVPEPSSQQTVPGALGVHVQRNEADPDPVPDTKTNSKRIKDLNVRPKPVRLSGKSTRRKLRDTGLGDDFLDVTPKAQVAEKNWTSRKLESFTSETIRVKRHATEWEKILQIVYLIKGYYLGYVKKLLKLNKKKTKQPDSKMSKGLE